MCVSIPCFEQSVYTQLTIVNIGSSIPNRFNCIYLRVYERLMW